MVAGCSVIAVAVLTDATHAASVIVIGVVINFIVATQISWASQRLNQRRSLPARLLEQLTSVGWRRWSQTFVCPTHRQVLCFGVSSRASVRVNQPTNHTS